MQKPDLLAKKVHFLESWPNLVQIQKNRMVKQCQKLYKIIIKAIAVATTAKTDIYE